jgi:creatinine amidohydrolase
MVQVDHPEQVRRQDYGKEMAFLAQPGLAAMPFPGSIILYKQDEGYPDFDPAKAGKLMDAVCTKVEKTILDVFRRWQTVR